MHWALATMFYLVLPEMPALCQSLPLLREPQLPQDSTEPDRCIGWARPCSLFQPDAGWNPIWTIVVSKSLDGFLHFYALYLGSNVCFCMCVSDHTSPSRSPALSPVPCHSEHQLGVGVGKYNLGTYHSHLLLPNPGWCKCVEVCATGRLFSLGMWASV